MGMAPNVLTEKQLWQIVLDRLATAKEISPSHLEWLRQSRLISTQSSGKYLLQVTNASIQHQIDKRCRPYIERALLDAIGGQIFPTLTIVTREKHPLPRSAQNGASAEPLFESEAPHTEQAEMEAVGVSSLIRSTRLINRLSPEQRRRKRDVQMRQSTSQPQRHPEVAVAPAIQRHPAVIVRPDPPVETEKPAWLNDRYTFDTFIVGKANHFAYAACRAVADEPGSGYNPLFLYGGVGLGKTHLLHAIAHAVAPRALRTLYITSETFTNEIINAIRYRTTEEFRTKYRSVDLLLVDDIQFIAGKDSTEEEFFHTFNALHESNKQIVMCSDRPPKAIDLEERLRSRFEWGLIADIQAPDLETRLAILRAKADTLSIDFPVACLDYLAERIQSNVRELEGMLNRVVTFSRLYRSPVTIDLIKQALSSLSPADKPRKRLTVGEITLAVARHYNVSVEDLRGKHRDKHIVMPRQVAMWLMRQETEASLIEIGGALGGRDHSTVIHGCDKIDAELQRDNTALALEIAAIRQMMMEQNA